MFPIVDGMSCASLIRLVPRRRECLESPGQRTGEYGTSIPRTALLTILDPAAGTQRLGVLARTQHDTVLTNPLTETGGGRETGRQSEELSPAQLPVLSFVRQ